ncbi:MAG: endonuclease III [Nitrospirales bacterium]|nr:endonuclease III [Nitrospirales bacterium]
MTADQFKKAWPLLKKQAEGLQVPYLDAFAKTDRDPFKVLISCILSLRTQDRTTAEASERLFAIASTPEALSELSIEEIEKAIYPVGFYRVKAERIGVMSREIVEKHHSSVPDTIEGLLALKGVGRKTANLVITVGFQKDGICVDTHVHRIANRWGLISTKSPDETEIRLREILLRRYWKEINGTLVAFGQGICRPTSPFCSSCTIQTFCAGVGVTRRR